VESRARARALQALYAWDVRSGTKGAADTAGIKRLPLIGHEVWEDLAVAPDERQLARRLVATVAERLPALDQELAVVATNWRLDRMSVVDRCVLRLAAAELVGWETPARVVIQEAVRLAERYGSGQSTHFVNGVLDALARRLGRL
jgi:N utilization substance protein B